MKLGIDLDNINLEDQEEFNPAEVFNLTVIDPFAKVERPPLALSI